MEPFFFFFIVSSSIEVSACVIYFHWSFPSKSYQLELKKKKILFLESKVAAQSSRCNTWYCLSAIWDQWGTTQETGVTKSLFQNKLLISKRLFASFYFHEVGPAQCLPSVFPFFCIHCSALEDMLNVCILFRILLITACRRSWFHRPPFIFSLQYRSCFKRLWFGSSSYGYY